MNTKTRFLSMTVMLVLIANIMLPWTQLKAQAATETTLTITDETLYNQLKDGWSGKITSSDDANKTLTLDMEAIETIDIDLDGVDASSAKVVLEQLFSGCTNLKTLELTEGDLSSVDFSGLDNRSSLTKLRLYECKVASIPDITLPNLTDLELSSNDLSGENALQNLTKENFGSLELLRLDNCRITDSGFALLGGVNCQH